MGRNRSQHCAVSVVLSYLLTGSRNWPPHESGETPQGNVQVSGFTPFIWGFKVRGKEPQVPSLRYAPVGITILSDRKSNSRERPAPTTELSSHRSVAKWRDLRFFRSEGCQLLGGMIAEEREGSHFVLLRVIRNRACPQQAIEHSLGVISNVGHDQPLAVRPMDHNPTIAANAIGPDVLKFLPGDAAGRTAP